MKEIERITDWDIPDTHQEPDGYTHKMVPDVTTANLHYLMGKVNELIYEVNHLNAQLNAIGGATHREER